MLREVGQVIWTINELYDWMYDWINEARLCLDAEEAPRVRAPPLYRETPGIVVYHDSVKDPRKCCVMHGDCSSAVDSRLVGRGGVVARL